MFVNWRDNNAISKIESMMKEENSKTNMYWFILPAFLKTNYGKFKKWAIEASVPKITQMTVDTTLKKKGFASVITKILIQMASKIGNAPWAPKPPKASGDKTMIIGVDTAADKVNNGTVVAFVATTASDYTHFYSSTCLQKGTDEFTGKAGVVVTSAIKSFYDRNKCLPEEIIILRNGCADSQISMALETEVKEVQKGI